MGNSSRRIGLDIRNDDAGTRVHIGASDPLAKSATCAGHDRYLSSQCSHSGLPMTISSVARYQQTLT
jgi:hypothetical protein